MNIISNFNRKSFLTIGLFLFFHCTGAGSFDELEKVGLPAKTPPSDLPDTTIQPPSPPHFDCTGFTPFESCESLKQIYLANQEIFEKNKPFHNWFQAEKNLCFWMGIRCNSQQQILQFLMIPSKIPIQLKALPSFSFMGLPYVQEIKLKNHAISKINTNTFANLPSLVTLDLSQNQIETIESNAFSGASSLQDLYLYENQIKEINTKAFEGLSNVKKLYLSQNKIETIEPDSFMTMDHLEYLDLSQNQMKHIKNVTFGHLFNLSNLNLSQNQIESIESYFHFNLKNLQYLNLSQNQIKKIAYGPFLKVGSILSWLNLSQNKIETIEPYSFHTLQELKYLNLFQNQMVGTIPLDVFYTRPNGVYSPQNPKLRMITIDDKVILPQFMCENRNLSIIPSTHSCYRVY